MENNKNYTDVSFEEEGFVSECLEAFDNNVEQIELQYAVETKSA